MYVFLNICPIYVLYGTGSYPPLETVLGTGRNIGTPCTFERRQIFLIHPD